MKKLQTLRLDGTRITDRGLRLIQGLEGLETLGLSDTDITDKGMKALRKLPKLRILDLSSTSISNDGLAELGAIGSLRELYLFKVNATLQGVNRLKQANPLLKVIDFRSSSEIDPDGGSGTVEMPDTGTVATFTDAYSAVPASDFSALVNFGDGSPPVAGTVTGPKKVSGPDLLDR
jgi:hypothetical protein